MAETSLQDLIEGCKQNDAVCQKALFLRLYNYGMSVAQRYASSKEDAEEIANDGFYKMLKNINQYKSEVPFKLWVRRIIINTGIDHFRKNSKKALVMPTLIDNKTYNLGSEKLDKDYLLNLLNELSPQYKMVFILQVIEGYTHKEIAKRLAISIGTSKSNLSKAREKLKSLLAQQELKENYGQ